MIIGNRARKITEGNYRTEKIIERGKIVLKDKKRFFRKKDADEEGDEVRGVYVILLLKLFDEDCWSDVVLLFIHIYIHGFIFNIHIHIHV
jgi:hypothetical protein